MDLPFVADLEGFRGYSVCRCIFRSGPYTFWEKVHFYDPHATAFNRPSQRPLLTLKENRPAL